MTASGPVAAPVPAPVMDAAALAQVLVEERGEVSALYVGRVIGKGGEMIRDLQARSGCRIDVDQSVPPGQPRIITYRGTQKTVDFAKQLVNLLCQENVNESDLPLGEAKREYMAVPATSVGKIIGRGGEMIRELQSRSHAKIQVDHNNAGATGLPATQKQLTITGTDLSVLKAKEMVNFLVANPMVDAMQGLNMLVEDKLHRGGQWGSGPPYLNLPNMGQNMTPDMVRTPYGAPGGYDPSGGGYGAAAPAYGAPMAPQGYGAAAGVPPVAQGGMPYGAPPVGGAGGAQDQEMIYVAKTYMGRLIGQKGVTINDLQRRSGSDIQINQDVPHGQDCEVTIRGGRQSIELAKQMIREIIEIGPNHPYAGGARTSYFIYCLFVIVYCTFNYSHVLSLILISETPPFQGGYGAQDPYGQGLQSQGGYYGGGAAAHYGGYQQSQQPAYGQAYGQQQHAPQQYSYGQPQQQQSMYGGAPSYGGGMQQQPQQQAYGGYSAPPQPPAAQDAGSWKTATAGDGQVYYYNEKTGETQWNKPPGMP